MRKTSSMDDIVLRTLVETQKAFQQLLVESQRTMQKQIASLTEALQKEKVITERSNDAAKAAGARGKGTCHYCKKPGHYRPECPDRLKALAEKEERKAAVIRTISSRDSSLRSRDDCVEWCDCRGNRYREKCVNKSKEVRFNSARVSRKNNSSAIPLNNSSTIPLDDSSAIPMNSSSTIPLDDSSTIPLNNSSTIPLDDSSAIR